MAIRNGVERVVITGGGAVMPTGLTAEASWQAILAGQHGIQQMEKPFPKSEVFYKASIDTFDPGQYMNPKLIKRRSRPTHLVVAAAKQAIAEARLPRAESTTEALRRGVFVGSGISNFIYILIEQNFFHEKGRLPAHTALKVEPEQAASTIAHLENFTGATRLMSTACASGATALSAAYESIKYGRQDVILAGGTDTIVEFPIAYATYEGANALAQGLVDDPSLISRPFSNNRRGFVIGEGAAMMVLESLSHAKARGANIIAEIKGVGETNGAKHETAPDVEGQVAAMNIAIEEAGLTPKDITHVNAHGTSTPLGDETELVSIIVMRKNQLEGLSICGTKSMTAHAIGATGAWEELELAYSVRDGVTPPTPNNDGVLDLPEELMSNWGISRDYKDYPLISTKAVRERVKNGITNSFGFGDINACLVIGEVD